ncbi:cytosine permease [Kineosporia mesophila]|uniref:Cytosine permease n=1 Tax=Kineosporia mesophila TaxID=566012 RepID=A0ABP7A1Q5_9ACTN|nr:cytosine permease [Kineosporia mesophila]MCD5348944.1 cytosine permease [Kineosporia mesophila]
MTAQTNTDSSDLTQYGDSITAVEPGGVERVPESARHGTPLQLLWTWASPNLEFATIYVGIIAVLFFGLSLPMAVLAVTLGNATGAITHGVLSSWGPRAGVPQMILSRSAFGFRGNVLPAGLNAVMAGIGWFAVNSVSGALALSALTDLSAKVSLVIIVLAELVVGFFGHNLVHAFERVAFPLLVIVFTLGAISVFGQADLGAPGNGPGFGGFTLAFSAAFGYAAGWNPYASDYTRYLPTSTSRRKTALYAGGGNFVSCTLLMTVGAAAASAGTIGNDNPVGDLTGMMPGWIGNLVLLGIALGAVSANALNVYSAAVSFLAMGISLPLSLRRAIVALGFGAVGFVLAWNGLADAGHKYEAFLLVIAYWIAPWLGVVLTDRWLRRGAALDGIIEDPSYVNLAGPVAMLVAMVVSVWLFCNQEKYVGPLASASVGDLTPVVGFGLAVGFYAGLFQLLKPARPTSLP